MNVLGWQEFDALATAPQTETAQLGDRTNRNAHD
jgi:hypothetical protein